MASHAVARRQKVAGQLGAGIGGWHTLSRIFLLTNSRSEIIALQYLDAEGLI